jgi:hypothetical protein
MINNLEEIYLCNMEWPVCVRVLYLLSDSTFLEVIFNYDAVGEGEWIKTFGGWTMREGSQRKGYFENREGIKILRYEGGPVLTYHEEVNGAGRSFTGPDGLSWVEIPKGDALYCHVIKGYSECINRIKFLQNQQSSEPINQKGWGRGRVYRDFNKDIVFEIV